MNTYDHLRAIPEAVDAAKAAGERYRAAREELRRDPRLTEQGREECRRRLHAEALSEVEDQRARALKAREAVERSVSKIESEYAPAELTRIGQTLDRQRVRSLLDAGTPPQVILSRASEQRDLATLEALRAEMAWQGAPEGVEVDMRAFGRRITEASLPLLPFSLAEARQAQMRLDAEWPAAQVWLDSAVVDLEAGPSLHTAIVAHYSAEFATSTEVAA